MNVEQLAYLVRRSAMVLDQNNIENLLAESAELLKQISNAPGNAELSNKLEVNLLKFQQVAADPQFNLFSPREIDLLNQMGIGNSVPSALFDAVYQLVHGSEVFAASNAQKMAELLKDVQRIKRIDASILELIQTLHLVDVLGEFGPEFDLGAELSFYVPKENADDSLNSLRKELRDFELLVSSAGELVGRRGYRVQYLSASDFGFILACYPEVVHLIVVALDQLTARVGQIKTALDMASWAFLKGDTQRRVIEEIEQLKSDQFLSAAEQITREMLAGAGAPDPEAVAKFSKALTITASKSQNGYVLDARLTMETQKSDPENPTASDADDGIVERRTISNSEIVQRLSRIEQQLNDQKLLPPPEAFGETSDSDDQPPPSKSA